MTKTAVETVAYFRSFNTHYWGPNTSVFKNQYNGQWYGNPHTVTVGRAKPDGPGEYYCADGVVAALMYAGIDIREACPGFCNCTMLFNFMIAQPDNGPLGFKSVTLAEAQPGDITFLVMGGEFGHVFMHREPNSGGNMLTVEGDTSNPTYPGSDSTGGVQCDRVRPLAAWEGKTHTFRPTGYAPPPAPAPATNTDTWVAGPLVVKALQHHFGTPADGVISLQYDGRKTNFPTANWTTIQWVPATQAKGSQLVRAIQKALGESQDGLLGPATARALQKWAGASQDGIAGPETIAAIANKLGVK